MVAVLVRVNDVQVPVPVAVAVMVAVPLKAAFHVTKPLASIVPAAAGVMLYVSVALVAVAAKLVVPPPWQRDVGGAVSDGVTVIVPVAVVVFANVVATMI